MSAQRPGASGGVRKTDRGSGRSLLVRSAVTGRFVAVREKARTAEPSPIFRLFPTAASPQPWSG